MRKAPPTGGQGDSGAAAGGGAAIRWDEVGRTGNGTMAGVIQFDRDQALDQAMLTFWRLGFSGTSIQALEAATGLGRGSLYNSFGGKEQLFIAGLDRYWHSVGSDRLRALGAPDPFDAMKNFLDTVVTQMGDVTRPRGCLFTNTSLEYPTASDAVLRVVAERMGVMEARLHGVLLAAREQRRIDPGADPRALARFYLGVVKGLGVLHKIHGDATMLADIARVAMTAWPHPPGKPARR